LLLLVCWGFFNVGIKLATRVANMVQGCLDTYVCDYGRERPLKQSPKKLVKSALTF